MAGLMSILTGWTDTNLTDTNVTQKKETPSLLIKTKLSQVENKRGSQYKQQRQSQEDTSQKLRHGFTIKCQGERDERGKGAFPGHQGRLAAGTESSFMGSAVSPEA